MKKYMLLATGLAVVLSLSACKLVKNDDGTTAAAADPIAARVAESFDKELIPALETRAVDLGALKVALSAGLGTAGEKYGVRVGGAGGSWNFSIKGTGVVVSEDRKSKAAVAGIDVDGDGKADANLQLGPVVRGTALRDTTTVYDFSNYRDQIQYAKLGRELNAAGVARIPAAGGELTGKTVTFLGATSMRSASSLPLIAPVLVEVSQ